MSILVEKVIPVATALIKNKEGKILLLQRSDIASYANYWQFVEGKLNGDENPEEALLREIQEEIGLTVKDIEITTPLYNQVMANGFNYLCFRIIFNVQLPTEGIVLSDEHRAFKWFTKKEALTLDLLPGVKEVLHKLL